MKQERSITMFRRVSPLVLATIVVALCSCATIQELVKKPDVTVEGMSLKDVSLFEGTMLFTFRVTNPNPIGVAVNNVAYDLKINGRDFVRSAVKQNMNVRAGGTSTVNLPVTVAYLDLFETVTEFMKSERASYDLSGSVGVGPFDIPFRTKGSLDIPRLPDISLKRVNVSSISLAGATVLFSLEMKNDNPFSVNLDGLDYGITLGGTEFVSGESRSVHSIGKKGRSLLEIPLDINFLKLGQSTYNLLRGSSSGYELTGEMVFELDRMGKKRFPFRRSGKVPLVR